MENPSSDNPDIAYDEKTVTQAVSHDEKNMPQSPRTGVADAAAPRKAVALNIVENPLKVSLAA